MQQRVVAEFQVIENVVERPSTDLQKALNEWGQDGYAIAAVVNDGDGITRRLVLQRTTVHVEQSGLVGARRV